ncbi:MAG: ParB/RepB/Spo0J family partition protein [Clostridiales bacterium]|nr:ParB/RepB/Spo0J family partition protein [Clostridiales bacterium]
MLEREEPKSPVKEDGSAAAKTEKNSGAAGAKSSTKAGKSKAEGASAEAGDSVLYLDIHDIKPNSDQPRKAFDKEKIAELAASILEHGVLQPIMVRPNKNGKGYEIVAGERRWRASVEAGLKKVPCLVRELTEEQNMLIALIENMQREDLNAIEEAEAIEKMISRYGLTQEQVSKSLGRSRPYITNALRLLKLPEEVRELVVDGKLSAGHARAIAGIPDADRQVSAARRAVEMEWSVRETEAYAGEKKKKPAAKKKGRAANRNQEVKAVEEELKQILGTKVNLVLGTRKGKIEIEYYSREELDRLIELLQSLK